MILVPCTLTCTIRRPDPSSDSASYRAAMDRLMELVSHKAMAVITDTRHKDMATLKSYEDKQPTTEYDIEFRALDSYVEAGQTLVTKFTDELQRLSQSETSYYLEIKVPPFLDEKDLTTHFLDVKLQTFALGFMSSPVQFHKQFDYDDDLMFGSQQYPQATIAIDEEQILIEFAVSKSFDFNFPDSGRTDPTTEVYKLSIDFKHMSQVLLVHSAESVVNLCFITDTPLQLWRTKNNLTDLSWVDIFVDTEWIRACRIVSADEWANEHAFDRKTQGGCNAFLLSIERKDIIESFIESLLESLQVVKFNIRHTVLTYNSPRDTLLEPAPFVEGDSVDEINWILAAISSIGYRVQYQLEDVTIGGKFMRLVERYKDGRDDRRHLHNSLCRTYDVITSDPFLHIDRVLLHFLNGHKELDELVMSRTRLVRRLVITPSRILLQAPCLMHDNRILREFDADSAVSCSFQNDDMTRFGSVDSGQDFVEEAIGVVLRNGVQVAGRDYKFLGCSGSQLKSKGCWMYARDPKGKTADDIRAWMGDLDHIRNPGTYLSRMGQCFSDTTDAELDVNIEIEWEDEDVEGGLDPFGKPYCFSDGVGRISDECLKLVFKKLPDQKLPSAFQVRLGGSKGMLTLDTNLTDKKIMVRKSMNKFASSHNNVEVMRRTQPTPLFLNKQVITLLSQIRGTDYSYRGIPDHTFIRLLNMMLHRLADILLDDDKALIALSESGFPCCYSKLHGAGFQFTTDPFFKGVLKAIAGSRISNVKQKARIEIPNEYGRAMLGVMDEEGVLEYGEVFVQYSANIKEPKVKPVVLKGDVIVSKMPAMHPGDIRKLKAVDSPQLRHLVDCIVFPRKGPRPHPNEMAGSDLDGDEYFVTWHPDLIFPVDNAAPMDFPSIRKEEQEDPITVDDMVDFMVSYITSDKVGVIANAHLAWADKLDSYSPKCTNLARIFCQVIDFSKTGYLPEEVKDANLRRLLPRAYPDFMDNANVKRTYPSKKILGKLYRISRHLEQTVTIIDSEDTKRINDGINWTIDERFLVSGYESYLGVAKKLYGIYAEFLDTEQRRYGIESEEELVSGCVIKIKGMYSRSDEVFDIEKRLGERMKDVRKLTLEKFKQFLDELMVEGQSKSQQEMKFAAACYFITYSEKLSHRSFPWVFAETLFSVIDRSHAAGPDPPLLRLTKSLDALDIGEIDKTYRRYGLERPQEDGLARIYHILIHWGRETKFLSDHYDRAEEGELSLKDYVYVLDHILEKDEEVEQLLYKETGPLLCCVIRAVTRLDDNFTFKGCSPGRSRSAVINMKRHILFAHHQLARDPRAESLMAMAPLKQGRISRNIKITKERWQSIENQKEQKKAWKEEYGVFVNFREQKHGGKIHIRGKSSNVFRFTEFWLGQEESPET